MYRVVIVDDEQNIREGIQELLDWKALQCKVVRTMKNGQQVVEYLEDNEVDIIITDIKMPVMDGIMLAKYIHENHFGIPVVILTAFSEFTYAQKAIKYQVADFVIKNEFLLELPQVIRRITEKLDFKNNENTGMRITTSHTNIGSQYRVCAGEIKAGHKLDILEKMPDIERMIKASISEQGTVLLFNDETSFYIIIAGENRMKMSEQHLERKLEKFIALAREFMRIELRLGVSEIVEGEYHISKGKKQAMEALAEVIDDEEVIQFFLEEYRQEAEVDHWDADIYMRSLMSALKENDTKELERKELEYVIYLGTSGRRIEQCKSDTHAITSYLLRKFKSLYPEEEMLFQKESIFEMIYLAKSKASLIDILQNVCGIMTQLWNDGVTQKSALVQKVDVIIRYGYQSKLGLKEISQQLFVNGSYLSRVYKKETNLTITDAINLYRVECAKKLLQEKEHKIYEVGNRVGIEDPAYFTHLFCKYEGMTPSEYKDKYE